MPPLIKLQDGTDHVYNMLVLTHILSVNIFSSITCVCLKTSVKIMWSWWTAPCPLEPLPWWLFESCWWVTPDCSQVACIESHSSCSLYSRVCFHSQDHDVQEDKILLVSLLMAEMGVHSVAYAFPQVKIITTAVDKKVNDLFHIIPGIGESCWKEDMLFTELYLLFSHVACLIYTWCQLFFTFNWCWCFLSL